MLCLITLLVWNKEISSHGSGVQWAGASALMITEVVSSLICDSGNLSPTSCTYLALAGLGAASAAEGGTEHPGLVAQEQNWASLLVGILPCASASIPGQRGSICFCCDGEGTNIGVEKERVTSINDLWQFFHSFTSSTPTFSSERGNTNTPAAHEMSS